MSLKAIVLLIYVFLGFTVVGHCQTIGEANLGQFYDRNVIKQGREPIHHPYLRESDVVWEHILWRTIDLHERFNQFFYYPTDPNGSQGLLNLTNLLWQAAKNYQIPIYEDDEFKVPIDADHFFAKYIVGDTVQLEIYDDEEGESFHYETVVVPKIFYAEEITRYHLKEASYIEKATTGQNFRILGLALIKDHYKIVDGEEEYMGSYPLFWVPFESMSVRRVLARHDAYFEDNIAHLPSWDEIFLTRTYSSFIHRESNRFNRSISDYLTGEDAMIEADRIEERILDIQQDMWEY